MRRITHVRPCLIVDAYSKEYDERSVDQEGYQRVEDGCDEHDPFAEEDEDREDRDYYVVVGGAGSCQPVVFKYHGQSMQTIDSMAKAP